MSPALRKFALGLHLTVSIGWIGAVVSYIALGVAAERSADLTTVRSSWTAMELIGWYAIVPLALCSLVTGVVMALGTRWGLFRHYWVIFSFAMTLFATIVLVAHMPTVSSMAATAQTADLNAIRSFGGDLAHPSIGLVLLLAVQFLNLYKPKGMTRYGQRKLRRA